MSGIGKGITTASIARVLQDYGFSVTAMKIDPYLNVDAGTMNPIEHGEVFVTDDGLESDQDLGNYERFLNVNMSRENYMTNGLVYLTVIQRERNLEYNGKCVEVVPHIPLEVIRRFDALAQKSRADFIIVEIGGTVGEYQNLIFLEAARMIKIRQPDGALFVLVSFLPIPSHLGEMKTKPTQYATRTLNSAGIQPDIIVARGKVVLDDARKEKLSVFCNIAHPEDIISAPDVESIYEVPLNFERDQIGQRILSRFKMKPRKKDGHQWQKLVKTIHSAKKPVNIGIVGKYFVSGKFALLDAYISVIEAVKHAAWDNGRKPVITWLNAESYEKDPSSLSELKAFDGIIVPGGFGGRGVEGKIAAIKYVREHNIPFLGLCYGMQLATVEFARSVAGLKDAHTTEINSKTPHPVITTMAEQIAKIAAKNLGGTMRLGAYACKLAPGTLARKLYGRELISERHRHRYEVSNEYVEQLEKRGLRFSGRNPKTNLVEIIELPGHPFFIGTQFHPELKSRPLAPHPLFEGFIAAAIKKQR